MQPDGRLTKRTHDRTRFSVLNDSGRKRAVAERALRRLDIHIQPTYDLISIVQRSTSTDCSFRL